ncbi:MAG: hypothetical protein Q8P58_00185 [Candidatus Adlerbacteria bacterium]|nr:hypothetical protein [Candidatus Adlerbacteria bacterium]
MAKKKTNVGAVVGVGVGVAAVATAAAGAYWLYGAKHSAKHRKMAKSWMLKARAEVLDAVEKLKEIDYESYMAIVDDVLGNYKKTKGATSAELAQMMRDFKTAWRHMQVAQKSSVKGAKVAKQTGKKVARKVRKAASKS